MKQTFVFTPTEARTSTRNWGVELVQLATLGLWTTKCDSFLTVLVVETLWLSSLFSIRNLYSSNVSFTKPFYVLRRKKSMESFHRFVEDLAHNLRTFVTQEKIRQTRIHSPQDDRKNYHKTLIFKLKRSNFLKLQILKRLESNKRKDCWASSPNFSSSKIF